MRFLAPHCAGTGAPGGREGPGVSPGLGPGPGLLAGAVPGAANGFCSQGLFPGSAPGPHSSRRCRPAGSRRTSGGAQRGQPGIAGGNRGRCCHPAAGAAHCSGARGPGAALPAGAARLFIHIGTAAFIYSFILALLLFLHSFLYSFRAPNAL